MSNKKYFDIKPKTYSMGVKFESIEAKSNLAKMLEKVYKQMYLNSLQDMARPLYSAMFVDTILWKSPRFVVSFTGKRVSIYDKTMTKSYKIKDIRKHPKAFTPALLRRLDFFEAYEKTQ
jgi:hypothetical protein